MLRVNNIEVLYDHVILALKGVSLEVPRGSMVALLGANGAGKSTTLKAIAGLLPVERGAIHRGAIELDGRPVHMLDAPSLVELGVVLVMEGRRVFGHLTVEENLLVGAGGRQDGRSVREALDWVYSYFPRLRERRKVKAGYTSGGEQQMLALGRALMLRPRLLLLDEPSMGLAPVIVQEIFEIVARLNQQEGVSVLLAEQNAAMALAYVHRGYVLDSGRVVLEGPAAELRENSDVKEFYLGLSGAGQRKSYREVKHYRRRKRWLS